MTRSASTLYQKSPPPTWSAIWQALPDPSCVVDRDGALFRMNASFCELLGRSPEMLHGAFLKAVIPDWMGSAASELLAAGAGNACARRERHGKQEQFLLRARTLRSEAGLHHSLWTLTPLDAEPTERAAETTGEPPPTQPRWTGRLLDDTDALFLWSLDTGTGRLQQVTGGAQRMLGYPLRAWLQNAEASLPFLGEEDQVRFQHAVQAALKLGTPQTIEHEMIRADGSRVPCVSILRPMPAPGTTGLIHGISMVRTMPTHECISTQRDRMDSCLAYLRDLLLSDVPFDQVLQQAVRNAATILRVDRVEITEYDPANQTLRVCTAGGPAARQEQHPVLSLAGYGLHAATLASQVPLFISGLRRENRFEIPDYLLDLNLASGVSMPIPGQNHPRGTLAAFSRTSSATSTMEDAEVQFLRSLARVLATGWEWAQRHKAYHAGVNALALRDEITAFGSHELSNLVAAMHLQVQLLRHIGDSRHAHEGRASDAQVERARQSFVRQIARLRSFSEAMLEISNVHSNRLSLTLSPVSLATLANHVVADYVQRKEVQIKLEQRACPTGQWDRRRLRLVLDRLLICAANLRPERPVLLSVDVEKAQAIVCVHVPGANTSAEELAALHDLHTALVERRYAALALDLFLIRALTDSHGGRFEFRNRPAGGIIFAIRLPCDPPSHLPEGR